MSQSQIMQRIAQTTQFIKKLKTPHAQHQEVVGVVPLALTLSARAASLSIAECLVAQGAR